MIDWYITEMMSLWYEVNTFKPYLPQPYCTLQSMDKVSFKSLCNLTDSRPIRRSPQNIVNITDKTFVDSVW